MKTPYTLPQDYVCRGSAYLVGTGPGLDVYTWPGLLDEDYILAVNFAGISCPRYNAFVALDTHRGGIFDDVYPRDTICWTMHPRTLMGRFFDCRIFRQVVTGAGCSSGAVGVCILHYLGYRKITAIGFDSHLTGQHIHADSLKKKGLYGQDAPASRVLLSAMEKTIILLPGVEVVFWNPSGDHLLLPGSACPSKP